VVRTLISSSPGWQLEDWVDTSKENVLVFPSLLKAGVKVREQDVVRLSPSESAEGVQEIPPVESDCESRNSSEISPVTSDCGSRNPLEIIQEGHKQEVNEAGELTTKPNQDPNLVDDKPKNRGCFAVVMDWVIATLETDKGPEEPEDPPVLGQQAAGNSSNISLIIETLAL
jgi:hypothetical protein